jgi:hypothetical protein
MSGCSVIVAFRVVDAVVISMISIPTDPFGSGQIAGLGRVQDRHPPLEVIESVKRREPPLAKLVRRFPQARALLHRDQVRQRPMVAFDEDRFARRRRVQDLAESLSKFRRGDGPHGQP